MIIVHYRRCWKYTVYIVLFHQMQNEYDIFEKILKFERFCTLRYQILHAYLYQRSVGLAYVIITVSPLG